MDERSRKFFEDVPVARELYFAQKCIDYVRARETVTYLTYARNWAARMTIVVDDQMLPISIDLTTGPGHELTAWLLTWSVGVSHMIQAELDDMCSCWPILNDLRPNRDNIPEKNTGAQIDPEGP